MRSATGKERGRNKPCQGTLPEYAAPVEIPPASRCDPDKERKSLIVIIPARNEQATVGGVVREIKALLGCEVVVVDDASTDRTGEEALRAGATVLRLRLQLNAWGAIQAGLRFAGRNGWEIAVTFDADGQHFARSIPALLAPIADGRADVVIGSFPARGSRARRIAWWLFRVITGFSHDDLTSGLRAYNSSAIAILTSAPAVMLDYQDMGVLLLLRRASLRMTEVPVTMSARTIGKSRVFSTWFVVFRYMLQTLILCLAKSERKWRQPDELLVEEGQGS